MQATAKARRPADPSRIPWAELLMRVFREDVLTCPCGGRRAVLAYLTEPGPVKAILDHLGLPSTGPPLMPTRFIAGSAEANLAERHARAAVVAALKAAATPLIPWP